MHIQKLPDYSCERYYLLSEIEQRAEFVFIDEASRAFGSSTIVSNVEAKEISNNKWEPYKNFGRDKTNSFALSFAIS